MNIRETTLLVGIFIFSQLLMSQHTIDSQVDRLHQYAGHWVSSVHANTDSMGTYPFIKMNNIENYIEVISHKQY